MIALIMRAPRATRQTQQQPQCLAEACARRRRGGVWTRAAYAAAVVCAGGRAR
jgi:hypothetical protein